MGFYFKNKGEVRKKIMATLFTSLRIRKSLGSPQGVQRFAFLQFHFPPLCFCQELPAAWRQLLHLLFLCRLNIPGSFSLPSKQWLCSPHPLPGMLAAYPWMCTRPPRSLEQGQPCQDWLLNPLLILLKSTLTGVLGQGIIPQLPLKF